MRWTTCILLCWLIVWLVGPGRAEEARRTISLDGSWQIAEGPMERMPAAFDHAVPVPGLVDLAQPAFVEVGTPKSKEHRQAFWYRRTFRVDGPLPAVARLKVHKACYGTRRVPQRPVCGRALALFHPVRARRAEASARRRPGRTNLSSAWAAIATPCRGRFPTAGTSRRSVTSRASTTRWS